MKRIQDNEQIDVRQLKFNVQKFEAALRAFGISFDHDKMNAMFSAKKSYLTCRDGILHGLKKASIDEVLANNDKSDKGSIYLTNIGIRKEFSD